MEVLEGAVEGLDPARDRQRLLGLYPTAFCPPPRFSFQPHMGDPVSVQKHTSTHAHTYILTQTYARPVTHTPPGKLPVMLCVVPVSCQVTQIAAQPQVQAELTSRLQQLQSRLSTLKIENEEVRHTHSHMYFTFPVCFVVEMRPGIYSFPVCFAVVWLILRLHAVGRRRGRLG